VGGCGGYDTRKRTGKTRTEMLEDDNVVGSYGMGGLEVGEIPQNGEAVTGNRGEKWVEAIDAWDAKNAAKVQASGGSNNGNGGVDLDVRGHLERNCPCGGNLARHIVDENGMWFIRPPMKRRTIQFIC
jgi:hypothetical protein